MKGPDDQGIGFSPVGYRRMSAVLRVGLMTSAVLFAVGLLDFVLRHPGGDLATFVASNPITHYLSPEGLFRGIGEGHSEALLTLAILVLVATPLARVATGVYYFVAEQDRPLARISLVVLVLLLAGIFGLGPLFH
jgi:uncharacterized membrane protein